MSYYRAGIIAAFAAWGTILGFSVWAMTAGNLSYAQALKKTNAWLLGHLLLHVAGLLGTVGSVAALVLLVAYLLGARSPARRVAAGWRALLVSRPGSGG